MSTFGKVGRADVGATGVALTTDGQARFTLTTPDGCAPVQLRLIGEHHVSNALAAAAVAVRLGMAGRVAAEALSQAEPLSPGRMEVATRSDDVTIINNAFNANPDSTQATLDALSAMANGRRTVAVLGEMAELGETATTEHEGIGRYAACTGVDILIAVGGHRAACWHAEASVARPGMTATLVPDISAAFELLRAELAPGDVVLVKSSKSIGLLKLAQRLVQHPCATV